MIIQNTSYLGLIVICAIAIGCSDQSGKESAIAENTQDTKTQELADESSEEQPQSESDVVENSDNEEELPELPSLEDVQKNPIDVKDDPYIAEPEKIEEVHSIELPGTWKRLGLEHEVWVDMKNKQAIAAGNICMNVGPLEVFACPRGTKEHESVVSVNALSSQIHAALLAVGAEPGEPVSWQEEYKPATGPVIKIELWWKSDSGEIKKVAAQQMVRDFKSGQPMKHDWVFGGSQTFTDDETGESYYYGDSGELVCLSNFSTATMDVPVRSSEANEGLLFEANTPNIPAVNTKVYLVFTPQIEKTPQKADKKTEAGENKTADDQTDSNE